MRSLTASKNAAEEKDKEIEKMRQSKLLLEAQEEQDRRKDFGYPNAESPAPQSPFIAKPVVHDSDSDSQHESGFASKNKMLVINRIVKVANGEPQWKSEVITDGRVISAYLRYRKLIEQQSEHKYVR